MLNNAGDIAHSRRHGESEGRGHPGELTHIKQPAILYYGKSTKWKDLYTDIVLLDGHAPTVLAMMAEINHQ